MTNGIVFQVDTERVLQILAKEIYDSPLALLRENAQNAFDAIKMRQHRQPNDDFQGKIEITINGNSLTIADNGIGMDEQVLRNNFWKAGSSGKNTKEAQAAGVVGTFGIGAMANFGVCIEIVVETTSLETGKSYYSRARRDSLKINEDCIELKEIDRSNRQGTSIIATLAPGVTISALSAKQYLEAYVGNIPVEVLLNGELISKKSFASRLSIDASSYNKIGMAKLSGAVYQGDVIVSVDKNARLLVSVDHVQVAGTAVEGSLFLLQGGGQLMGMRSRFGLAPIPFNGIYEFGGVADLSILKPTAGREAVSRESIEIIAEMIGLIELAASECLAKVVDADKNGAFIQWVVTHGRFQLAHNITVQSHPGDESIRLGETAKKISGKDAYWYGGNDQQLIATFANESTCVLQLSQSKPRRMLQQHFLMNVSQVPELPRNPQVLKVYDDRELALAEAAIVIRTISVLRDDYLMPDIGVKFADISHGVTVLPEVNGSAITLFLARGAGAIPMVTKCYNDSYEFFGSFVKDYVRTYVYKKIQHLVPSSTRDGVDALRKVLERNRELYRYEESEYGELESVLGDYLTGSVSLTEVLKSASSAARAQSQRVSREHVGSVERELADMINSPVSQALAEGEEYLPAPPFIREELDTDFKILVSNEKYLQLNGFSLLLGLSDRLFQRELEFFRNPHTTKLIWGGHRVVYIFTEMSGRISLYYDIELREPLSSTSTGGGAFPTTTIITKKRIFVPVPDPILDAFRITGGAKEFFVRFDTLYSDVAR